MQIGLYTLKILRYEDHELGNAYFMFFESVDQKLFLETLNELIVESMDFIVGDDGVIESEIIMSGYIPIFIRVQLIEKDDARSYKERVTAIVLKMIARLKEQGAFPTIPDPVKKKTFPPQMVLQEMLGMLPRL